MKPLNVGNTVIRMASGMLVEVPRNIPIPPDYGKDPLLLDFSFDLLDRGKPNFATEVTAEGSKGFTEPDPTGFWDEGSKVYTSIIFASIDPKTGGLLHDGMHRPYPQAEDSRDTWIDRLLGGTCPEAHTVMSVDVYVDADSVLEAVNDDQRILAIGGDSFPSTDYKSDTTTKLIAVALPDGKRGYAMVPLSFIYDARGERSNTAGRVLNSNGGIALRTWTRLMTIRTPTDIWTLAGEIDKETLAVKKMFVTSYLPRQQKNAPVCRAHFGPYVTAGISDFKIYQRNFTLRIYSGVIPDVG